MVQSVELLLDERADASVRSSWRTLAHAGLPSLAAHTGATNRPHVTLAAHPWLPDGLDDALADAVGDLPLLLRLGSPVVFPAGRRSVVALEVDRTPALVAAQAAVLDVVRAAGGPGPAGEHLQPHRWTPHVTLALRLPTGDVERALAALGPTEPVEASGVAVRRWDSERRVAWTVSPRAEALRPPGT